MKKTLALILSLLLLLIAFGAQADETTIPVQVTVTFGQTEARSMLDLINEFRGSEAKCWEQDPDTKEEYEKTYPVMPPLAYDYTLEKVAMQRAAELALYFAHNRPDNATKYAALFPSAYSWKGENIAAGLKNAESAFIAWREDDEKYDGQGHRRNMLEDFTCIGIGHAVYNGMHFWVQELGRNFSPDETKTGAVDAAQTCTVDLSPTLVKTVSADSAALSLEAGNTAAVPDVNLTTAGPIGNKVSYAPVNASDKPVWASSDSAVAKVADGKVTAVSVGKTVLTATVLGKDLSVPVTVTPKSLENASLTLSGPNDLIYAGFAYEPAVTVSYGDTVLVQDQDFTVSYADNINAGTATVTVTGKGNYTGSKSASFVISPAPISEAETTAIPDQVYTGREIVPALTVTRGGSVLAEGIDYTVTYTDNINAGTAAVTVTGAGNYTGSTDISFTIGKAALTVTAKDHAIVYGDAPGNSGAIFSGFVNGETESVLDGTLVIASDYAQYGNIGNYVITPSGLMSGNYAITFTSGKLTVEKKPAGLTWGEVLFTYDGAEHLPEVAVTGIVNNDTITAVVSDAGTDAGEYTATVTGLTGDKAGNYSLPDNPSVAFRIEKAVPVVTAPQPVEGLQYTGKTQALITAGSTTGGTMEYSLEQEVNYSAELPAAAKAGSYTVWYRVDGGANYESTEPQSVTAVIREKPKFFTITFKANGGEGKMPSLKVEAGSKVTLSTNRFSKSKYVFNCWSIAKNGKGKSYKDKQSITVTKSLTLYAQWSKIDLTLKKGSKIVRGKKFALQAKLKIGGKSVPNKKITITFNGKTYKVKTNSKGIAKVTVNAKATKKLKLKKQYKITVKYRDVTVKGEAKVVK